MAPDPLQYLSYLAGRTSRVKLIPGAVILPWNDPVRVAEKVVLLDHLAPGRAGLAFGRGLSRVEYTGFRQDMNESRERFDEAAELVVSAVETGFMEGHGKFYEQPRVELRPRPLGSFRDRLYSVAVSPSSANIAAEMGAAVMTFLQGPVEGDSPHD